ncbi:MAG: nucleosidase [Alphaproteobacteria bacterium]
MRFNLKNTLFCFALKEEAKDQFDDLNCLFTDMGKINAAFALTKHLVLNPEVEFVVNLGTCGSQNLKPASIVCATTFYQRDWSVPFLTMPTDHFEKITYGIKIDNILEVACGTGDSFVSEWPENAPYEIVDMEAFALASVCQKFQKKFICLKSVSDAAGENDGLSAIEQWNLYLEKAAHNLRNNINNIENFADIVK